MEWSSLNSDDDHHDQHSGHHQAPSNPFQTQFKPYYAQHYYDASSYHYPQYYSSSSALSVSNQSPPADADQYPSPATAPSAQDSSHHVHQNCQHLPDDVKPPVPNEAEVVAAAALSQMVHFAGTMGTAESAMGGMHERQWHDKGHHQSQQPNAYPYHQHSLPSTQHGAMSICPAVGDRASLYRGSGCRRGGGPARGDRGSFSIQCSRQDVRAPPSHGMGQRRGQAGGCSRRQYPGQPPAAAVVVSPTLVRHPLVPIARCDICCVDCSSKKTLEQHRNGKRHKNSMQRFAQTQAQKIQMANIQVKNMPKPQMVHQWVREVKTTQMVEADKGSPLVEAQNNASVLAHSDTNFAPAQVVAEAYESSTKEFGMGKALEQAVGEVSKASASLENIPSSALATRCNIKFDLPDNDVEEPTKSVKVEIASSNAVPSEIPLSDSMPSEVPPSDAMAVKHDMNNKRHFRKRKRKKRFNHGGKRFRYFDHPKQPLRVCTLCNAICYTLDVFEWHLISKKHQSRIRRFQSQGTVFGPITVYIPPNRPIAHCLEPVFYALKSNAMLQQESYGLNKMPLDFSDHKQHSNQTPQTIKSEGEMESQTKQESYGLNKVPLNFSDHRQHSNQTVQVMKSEGEMESRTEQESYGLNKVPLDFSDDKPHSNQPAQAIKSEGEIESQTEQELDDQKDEALPTGTFDFEVQNGSSKALATSFSHSLLQQSVLKRTEGGITFLNADDTVPPVYGNPRAVDFTLPGLDIKVESSADCELCAMDESWQSLMEEF